MKASGADALGELARAELTMTQLRALMIIDWHGDDEISFATLIEQIGVSPAAASRAVDGLAVRELVERREDPEDRRAKRLRVAPAGRALAERIRAARISALRSFVAGLPSAEAAALEAALTPIVARADISACRPKEPSA